jgi:hypothetical protein
MRLHADALAGPINNLLLSTDWTRTMHFTIDQQSSKLTSYRLLEALPWQWLWTLPELGPRQVVVLRALFLIHNLMALSAYSTSELSVAILILQIISTYLVSESLVS